MTAVEQFHELLLAEAELMVGGAQRETSPARPQVKAMQMSPGNLSKGCRMGRGCKFSHPQLEDRQERCWLCSGKDHRKADCPHRGSSEQPGGSDMGAVNKDGKESSGSKGGKSKKGSGKGPKGNGKAGKEELDKNQGASSTTPTTASTSEALDKDKEGQQKTAVRAAAAETGTGELVSEVTSLLRSMRLGSGEPRIRVCYIKKTGDADDGAVLLGGGATHCIRQVKNNAEWNRAREITVHLATGKVVLRQDPESGVVLTQEPTQTIIPMSRLMDVGYVLKWDEDGCKITHPRHGRIPLRMVQGCPMVDSTWGQRLMAELEKDGRRRAHVRMIMACGMLAESSYEKDLARLRADFPEVLEEILERVPSLEEWLADHVPLNRRQRRRIETAKNGDPCLCRRGSVQMESHGDA